MMGKMCNDCWLSMQNCHDMSICCDNEEYEGDECEWFEPIDEAEEEGVQRRGLFYAD